ncbi:Hypothetical protein HVR_LOCUS673 [uncultured virus]|nr:Hypothetical protein HVR_LOCUS673 [uncultured virus]
MGIMCSINHTTMAQSVIGYKFKTTKKVCFGYCGYDKNWIIDKWKPRSTLSNPKLESFDLEVISSIEFMIINVTKSVNIENGTNIHIQARISNDVPLNTIGHCRESIIDQNWVPTTIKTIKSSKFPKMQNGSLMTKGLEVNLYSYSLGVEFPKKSDGSYNFNGTITVKEDILNRF